MPAGPAPAIQADCMRHTLMIALCLLVVFSALAFGAAEKQMPLAATVDRASVKVGEHILLTVRGGAQPYAIPIQIDDFDCMGSSP